jgi:4-hydroxythreonine-4-phosphate dehydrogenase
MKKIGITLGDPAGIGYECIVKSTQALEEDKAYILYGEELILREAIERFNPDFRYKKIKAVEEIQGAGIYLLSLDRLGNFKKDILTNNSPPIKPSEISGYIATLYLGRMAADLLKGNLDALTTLPISKYYAQKGGKFRFEGHTEFLAFVQKVKEYAMLMYSEKLKVVLQTIHIPLSQVVSQISQSAIKQKLLLIDKEFKRLFNITPRIGVLGLNPHAGEEGKIGKEEKEIIQPAIEEAKKMGIKAEGPLVPDTAFLNKKYDVFLAMYHDQGLIPFKLLAFYEGVNITLGLPIPRTSPAHGTAFNIAWKGLCNPLSTIKAIKLANTLASIKK